MILVKQKVQASRETKQFAFKTDIFHTFEPLRTLSQIEVNRGAAVIWLAVPQVAENGSVILARSSNTYTNVLRFYHTCC